jgi:uncharacterized cupin superfamily protein
MTPLLLNGAVPELKPWGTPESLRGTTLEGQVRIFGLPILGDGRSELSAGWFAASQGRYRLVYPFHEHATLVEGELALTSEATGQTVLYRPGDSWVIAKGEPVVWDIRSDRAVKHYLVSFHDLPEPVR